MRAWLPPLLYALLVLAASSIPAQAMPTQEIFTFDKVLHGTEYAVFGALLFRGIRLRVGWEIGACAVAAVVVAALFGCLDETYQRFTPGRDSSGFDALADAVGATIGVALAWTFIRRRAYGDDPQLPG